MAEKSWSNQIQQHNTMIDDDIIAALNYRLIYGHDQSQNQPKQIMGSNYQIRQNKGLVQGSEFHAGDSSGSSMQGMQATGMVGRFPQNNVNGSMAHPRQMMRQGQTGQQMPQRAPAPAPASDAAQFNFQPPLTASTRQNTVLVQGSEFQSRNSSEPPMQGTQATGMVVCFSQDSVNEPMVYTQRMMRQGQTRQQMPQQTSRTSAQGQSQQTTSCINSRMRGFARNEEASMAEISLSHQQWMEQMHTISPNFPSYRVLHQRQQEVPSQSAQASMPMNEKASTTQSPLSQQKRIEQMHTISPDSPSYRVQHQRKQQIPLQHRLASSSQSAQASMPLKPRQQSHIVEQCQSAVQPQEQSPRTAVPSGQNSLGFMGSQSGTEASNQLLGKRKIQDLVSQVDKHGKLDPEVEDLLLEFADDFIDSVTAFACRLAKHRKSSTVEPKDVLLHLEKNWGLTIPGYSYHHTRQDRVSPGGCNHLFRPSLDMVFLTNTSQTPQQTTRMQ